MREKQSENEVRKQSNPKCKQRQFFKSTRLENAEKAVNNNNYKQ